MVELRHIRYFDATAENGTVSAAAAEQHVTQPGLSRQLVALERELGVALFDRRAGRLTLSRTGRELMPRALDLLAAAEALLCDAAFHAEGGVRRITITAPTVTLTDVVSPFVAVMTRNDPVVDTVPGDGLSTGAMLNRGADLAIGIQRPQPPFRWTHLASLPVWAYVPPDHVWASRSHVPLTELASVPVVGLPKTFTAREALDAAMWSGRVVFSSLLEAANGTIAQALAASGRGVAVVSDDPRFGLVPVRIGHERDSLAVHLVAAWDSRSLAAPVLSELASRLRAWVCDRYEAAPD